MEINRKKLMYSILRELNNNSNIDYTGKTFEVDDQVFEQTIEILIDEQMVRGFKIARFIDGSSDIQINNPRITLKGIEFLEENNEWKKLYKGLKEIKSWLPFMN